MIQPLRFSPETGPHAPRMRVSVFRRGDVAVLRMVVPDGRWGEATYPTMDEALAAVRPTYRQLTGERA